MRFIGNKELITTAIIDLLEEKGLVSLQHNLFSEVKEVKNPLTFFRRFLWNRCSGRLHKK